METKNIVKTKMSPNFGEKKMKKNASKCSSFFFSFLKTIFFFISLLINEFSIKQEANVSSVSRWKSEADFRFNNPRLKSIDYFYFAKVKISFIAHSY